MAMAIAWGSLPSEGEESDLELYVIASESIGVSAIGSGFPGYHPAVLYRVEDGNLVQVRAIATSHQGSLFTRVFHDKGYALVGSEGARPGSILLDVLDMRSLAIEKTHDLDFCATCAYWGSHLLNRPEGLVLLVHAVATGGELRLLRSFGGVPSLDKDWPWGFFLQLRPSPVRLRELKSSFLGVNLARQRVIENLDYGALRDAYTYGASGGLAEGEDYVYPVHEANGEAVAYFGNAPYPLGWRLPHPLRSNAASGDPSQDSHGKEDAERLPPPPVTVQTAHNDQLRALADVAWGMGPTSARAFHVFDKSSRSWARIVLRGEVFQMRAYEPWLAIKELYDMSEALWKQHSEYARFDAQRAPFSLRANYPSDLFPSTAQRLSQTGVAPAGRLHLYHVHRQRHVTHATGEMNSEVLFVDDKDHVYYRVNDELRRARVGDGGFDDMVVLAKHPVILAVHHLFFAKY